MRAFGGPWRGHGGSRGPGPGGVNIGPCRCGFGPHAYWVGAAEARSFWQGPWGPHPSYGPEEELEELKREKREVDRRIEELEGRMKAREEG